MTSFLAYVTAAFTVRLLFLQPADLYVLLYFLLMRIWGLRLGPWGRRPWFTGLPEPPQFRCKCIGLQVEKLA